MEQLSHMADQTPMKSTPTAVSLFQTIKGVFPGSSNNRQISLDEISDTMECMKHIFTMAYTSSRAV